MAGSTTRLNLTKPASAENVNITLLDDNFDLLDSAVGATVGASSARPASAFSGRLWYETDTARFRVNTATSASTAASWVDAIASIGATPEQFGVIGSGNDTAMVQAAINAQSSLVESGQIYAGRVILDGPYTIAQVYMKDNVYVIGSEVNGQGYRERPARLFPHSSIPDGGYMINASASLRNVAIVGVGSYGGGSASKTGFANLSNITDGTFSSLHVDNYGIEAMLLGGSNNRVSYSFFRGLLNRSYAASSGERGAFSASGADHQFSHVEFTGPDNATVSSSALNLSAAKVSVSDSEFNECIFQIADVGENITGGSRVRYIGNRWDSNAAHGLALRGGTYLTFGAGNTWSRNSYSADNTYDHINVPSSGGSQASFDNPQFNDNTHFVKYWINDAKDSAGFHNFYLSPYGEAASTANWNLTGASNPSIVAGVEPTSGRLVARQLWTQSTYGLRRTSALAEAFSRVGASLTNVAVLTSGRLNFVAVYLTEGQVISQIGFWSGTTALSVGSNQWFGLWSAARAQLRLTADDTSTAWAANAEKVLTLSSSYTVPSDGVYYLSCMVNATTVPTLLGLTSTANIAAGTPALTGFDGTNTGLTTPATAPSTAAAFSSTGAYPWAYVK